MARHEFDHYRAEPEKWATEQLERRLFPALHGRFNQPRILEPCNGTGNIGNTLRALFPGAPIVTNDIDPRHVDNDHHLDAANADLYDPAPDWIITNPPFNLAPILIPIFVREARRGVACILRLTYLEPVANRGVWLAQNPPDAVWTLPRMSFTGDGKVDSVTAAWFVWTKEQLGTASLMPILKASS